MNSKSKFLPWIVTAAVLVVAIVATTVTGVTMKNSGFAAGRAAGYSAGYAEGLAAAEPAQVASANEGGSNASGFEFFAAEETTEAPPLTTPIEIKITFDAVGGTATETERTLITGELYGELPEAEKPSQELAGWYTAKEGGDKITPETILDAVGDVTVYAHWIAKEAVHIADLDYFSKKNGARYQWGKISGVQDNEGQTHRGWGMPDCYYDDNIVWLLDCKYTKLEGTLFLYYNDRNTQGQLKLKIYCDNKLVYTSPLLTSGVRPITFSIDVKNVEQLKFETTVLAVGRLGFGIDATLAPI